MKVQGENQPAFLHMLFEGQVYKVILWWEVLPEREEFIVRNMAR